MPAQVPSIRVVTWPLSTGARTIATAMTGRSGAGDVAAGRIQSFHPEGIQTAETAMTEGGELLF